MPYSKDELENLPFYQSLANQDEAKYLEQIQKTTDSGDLTDGILRDKQSKNIILFEKIIPGQGTDGTSHTENHTISYQGGYWIYEENEELNKIIKREFTEF
tara:strand:- start:1839 stop:2141 length:303 start_codon:yes stop_codon:yes gene_type:complete